MVQDRPAPLVVKTVTECPLIKSAALLVYRLVDAQPQFWLAHPGGPFWRTKDAGAWSIPKGLVEPGEAPDAAARREFQEETGLRVEGTLRPLSPCRAYRGKMILPFLIAADLDLTHFHSQSFSMTWPPRSGRSVMVPEIDRIGYFPVAAALDKILPAQASILIEARDLISGE